MLLKKEWKRNLYLAQRCTGSVFNIGGGTMPRGNGKGPLRGRKKSAMGPGGNCVCVPCGVRIPHKPGKACTEMFCPQCGKPMLREELLQETK